MAGAFFARVLDLAIETECRVNGGPGQRNCQENRQEILPINQLERFTSGDLSHGVAQRRHRDKQRIQMDNDLTAKVIKCAIDVHRALGPGLLESAYRECLYYELQLLGLRVEKKNLCP